MKENYQNLKSNSKYPIFDFLFSKSSIILLLSTFYFLFSVSSVFAAEALLEVKAPAIRVGDEFEVGLFLNTENEDVNAVEGKVVFPEHLLELKGIYDGNSIINLWIERPNAKNGEILFSGIVPGGYLGKKGPIFSVVFQSKQEGSGSIEIQDMRALLNDGNGTGAHTTVSDVQFSVSKQTSASPPAVVEKKDTDRPEIFKPIVTINPTVFDGKYFLVFATQDKGSGIDRYEIREGDGPFILARSPYLLQNQNLDKEITVKAVDRSGNVRTVTVPAEKPMTYQVADKKNTGMLLASAVIVIAAALVAKLLWRRHTKSS
ncbi:MAG: cohesin domain-containing protein [Patescibacteria group bacterium]|nr:cohesin domain-containing protein [Patescibacteria group bacterium]